MPGISVHLGSLHLDFSRKFASHSSAVSSCESNIHSAQHVETHSAGTMERIYTNYVLHGENNASSMRGQRKNFIQSAWNRYINGNFLRIPSTFLSKMHNPLSVTLVNDDLIRPEPEFMEKTCIQEETSIDIKYSIDKFIYETMQSVTTVDPFIKNRPNILSDRLFDDINKMQLDNKDITVEDLTYSMMDSSITCKDESTMESHSVSNVRETENLNNISDNSCPTEIDLQKCTDTDKDTLDMKDKKFASNDVDVNEDAKSFLIVSHLDVPELVKPVKRTPISARLSVMCRNAWNSLTTRFYCKTNSVDSEISVKRSSYLSKRHRRRKANAIAMGRGRGRARCQLRRSGVSQTRHRKERDLTMIIEVDYELYRNDEIQYCGIRNDHSLNDKSDNLDDMDGYDVPDGALFVKRPSPVILSSSDVTPTKQKPQTPKNQETVKHPTRVRYVIDPSTKSNKDCNKKTSDIEKNPCQSQLSVNSVDSEDSFIVFEASDDESSKQKVAEYSIEMSHTLDSSMKSNKDCNSEIYDKHDNQFRSRLLSESSVDSEDSFIIFVNESPKKQEAMKYPTRVRYVVDPLTKIDSSCVKDCNSETYNAQKDTLRPRLLSESSCADSEDSFIVFESSDDESSKQGAAEDPTGIYSVSDSSTKINNVHCKDYNSKKYMQEDPFQFSENSEDTEDSFCIVFNTELEENCMTDNFNYIKTNTSTLDSSIEDESMIENDEDSKESMVQMKKVSFAPVPVVHIMITWNYAYRAARKGQWEEMARDHERFKGRVNSIAAVLNPILTNKHRSKVWQERFAHQE